MGEPGAGPVVGMPPERQQMFLSTLLDSLASGVVACDAEGNVVVFNQPMRQSRPHIPGLHIRDIAKAFHLYAADGRTPLEAEQVPLARALAGERIDAEQVVVRPPGRRPRCFAVTGRPIDTPDGHRLGALVVLDDITEAHRAGVLTAAQHAVSQVLAEAASAEQAAVAVVAAVTEALGWSCGEYWQVTPDQAAIARVGSWTAPHRDLSAFLAGRPGCAPARVWPAPPGPVAVRCGSATCAATRAPSSANSRRCRPACGPRSACRCAAAARSWAC